MVIKTSQNSLSSVRENVISQRMSNPCSTLQSIGDSIGITRERVRQILEEHRLPTRHITFYPYRCLNCNKPTKKGPDKNDEVFCSQKCRSSYHRILIACEVCGTLKEYRTYYLLRKNKEVQKHFFCSRHCLGVWLGSKYGWGTRRKGKKDEVSICR